jgi:hypothetical protein
MYVFMYVFVCARLFVSPSVCLSVFLFVCQSDRLFVCPSVYLSVCMSVCLALFLSGCLPVGVFVYWSVCLCLYPCGVCLRGRVGGSVGGVASEWIGRWGGVGWGGWELGGWWWGGCGWDGEGKVDDVMGLGVCVFEPACVRAGMCLCLCV